MSISPRNCVRMFGSHDFRYSHSLPVYLPIDITAKPSDVVEYRRPAHWRVSYCERCHLDSYEAIGFVPSIADRAFPSPAG
jgi:hypothetical protein